MTGILHAKTRYVPPLASNFPTLTGTNAEAPTLTDTTDRGLLFSFGSSPAAGDNWRYALKNKPTSTAYDIIARFMSSPMGYSFYQPGIILSDGTKHVYHGLHNGSAAAFLWCIQQWSNQTTFSSTRTSTSSQSRPPLQDYWLRVGIVAGAPTDFYISHNGQDWVKILSESQGAFMTYTKIGFGCNVNRNGGCLPISGTPHAFINIMYWSDADIVPGV